MSRISEERSTDNVAPLPTSARVIPFERPQSDLQRAVQERAQELMRLERERAEKKPAIWRLVVVMSLAVIPVFLTFSSSIAFVGALRQFGDALASTPQKPAKPTAPGPESDIVMLQTYSTPAGAAVPQKNGSQQGPSQSR